MGALEKLRNTHSQNYTLSKTENSAEMKLYWITLNSKCMPNIVSCGCILSIHKSTVTASDLFGQAVDMRRFRNSRHFVKFAAILLQVGSSELRPHSWVHSRTYSACMFPPLTTADLPYVCYVRGLHMCVHSGMSFFFLPCALSVAFLWGIFPDSFFFSPTAAMRTFNKSCFLLCIEKFCFSLCYKK